MITFDKWIKTHKLWEELTKHYYQFPLKFKKELEEDYNIDSGTDYANYIFAIGELEH